MLQEIVNESFKAGEIDSRLKVSVLLQVILDCKGLLSSLDAGWIPSKRKVAKLRQAIKQAERFNQ